MTREKRTAIGASIAVAVCMIYRLLPLTWPEETALRYGRMCMESVLLLGVPAVLMRPWRSSRLPAEKRWWVYGLFVLAALALQMLLQPFGTAWSEWIGAGESARYPMPDNPMEWMLMICALVIVPAVCEEAFFRGAILCGLIKKLGRAGAFWLTAAVFVLLHLQPGKLPFHMAVSLLTTMAMMRTGKVWLPMLMHGVINAVGLMN